MNWRIGFFIWLKGVGIFFIPCLPVAGIGWMAFLYSFTVSWVAIPVYAVSIWVIKKLRMPFIAAMATMTTLPVAASVLLALYLFKYSTNEFEEGFTSIAFWVPLICCCLAVLSSPGSIYLYLHPGEDNEQFATE